MPFTPEELMLVVNALISQRMPADDLDDVKWADGTAITDQERRDIAACCAYAITLRKRRNLKAQRRSMRLLRSMLTAEQRRDLGRTGAFRVVGSRGGLYRLMPRFACTEQVQRHGSRWFAKRVFCLHDDGMVIPRADLMIAHMLLLITDEQAFLETANDTPRADQLWNRDYLRRMRERRRENRETGVA